MILAGLRQSARGRETRGWTRTSGRITSSYVEEIPGPAEDGGTHFRSVVRYAYEARGRTFESERVSVASSPVSTTADRAEAQQVVDRYPAGSAVNVWFDPGDPHRSVLERGVPRAQAVIPFLIGLALIGAGLFLLAR
jgi:hypothetical protein